MNKLKILTNSVPKSGTNLLMQIILGIPRIKRAQMKGTYDYNFNQVKRLKWGEMTWSHISYQQHYLRLLNQWGIKVVFISRDPRDVAVSMTHYIMEKVKQKNPLYPYLKNLKSHEQRLMTIIRGINPSTALSKQYRLTHYPGIIKKTKPIYNWLKAPGICCVRYEDLMRNNESRTQSLHKIVDFLWVDLQKMKLTKSGIVQKMEQNINPNKSYTFRKGKIDSWKDEFTKEHKDTFKRIAGNFLIELGYEKDLNW